MRSKENKIDRGDSIPTIIHISKSKKPVLKKIARSQGYRGTKHMAETLVDKMYDEHKDSI